jgi:hypothetical protein
MILNWSLAKENQTDTVEKYCPDCGKKVLFFDSGMRRRNANGKDIYEYAIFKCPKEHSWNKSIRQYKANGEFIKESKKIAGKVDLPLKTLVISECINAGIEKIEIYLDSVEGKWRIDKLLAACVQDLSRTKIQWLIQAGLIMVNDQTIQPDELLKPNQKITLFIHPSI